MISKEDLDEIVSRAVSHTIYGYNFNKAQFIEDQKDIEKRLLAIDNPVVIVMGRIAFVFDKQEDAYDGKWFFLSRYAKDISDPKNIVIK